MLTLDDWSTQVCVTLGLPADAIDRDVVLDLARDTAHAVARPAAPLTAYLAGLAAGRGGDPADIVARIRALLPPVPDASADTPAATSTDPHRAADADRDR